MVTQDEARKYAPIISLLLRFRILVKLKETNYISLSLTKKPISIRTQFYAIRMIMITVWDNLTVVLCQEPKMTWRLDYGFEGSTGAFYVWVDALTGNILKYSAILAD